MRATWADVLTLLGLLSGISGIVLVMEHHFEWSFYAVCGAALFDALDGAVARAMGVASSHGKLLDALSDMVSFGALPTIWIYAFVREEGATDWITYLVLLLAPAVAIRLTIFMIKDTSDRFYGLPSPAGALFLMSLCFLPETWIASTSSRLWIVYLTVGTAGLMISSLPTLSIKFAHYRWRGNQSRYLFLILAAVLILWLQMRVFLVLIPVYLLYSVLVYMIRKTTRYIGAQSSQNS